MFDSLLSSDPKSSSAMRASFLLSAVVSNLFVFILWAVVSLKQGALANIPDNVIWLYALANGIAVTGKVVQKQIEENANKEERDAG